MVEYEGRSNLGGRYPALPLSAESLRKGSMLDEVIGYSPYLVLLFSKRILKPLKFCLEKHRSQDQAHPLPLVWGH